MLWISWGITVVLIVVGILVRAYTDTRGSGDGYVYLAAALMFGVAAMLRSFRSSFLTAIAMSIAGLGTGGVIGMFARSILLQRSLAWSHIAIWTIVTSVATILFLRQLSTLQLARNAKMPTLSSIDFEALKQMSPEEKKRVLEQMRTDVTAVHAWSQAELNRSKQQVLVALVILGLGVGVSLAVGFLARR